MGKILNITLIIVGFPLLIVLFMFIFHICPPYGPWPMPPWCPVDIESAGDNVTFTHASARTSDAGPDKSSAQVFSYSPLSYIPESGLKLRKDFVFGVGMMDLWGRLCTGLFTCYNPKDHVKTSFRRLGQLGSGMVMVTDFYQLDRDENILDVNQGGARTISPEDMKFLIDDAHDNNLSFMLMTNLYEKDHSREVLNQKNPKKEELDKLFDGWKDKILSQAKKGAYDYLVIDPRDISFFFEDAKATDYMNQRFVDLIPEIRKYYSGKICLWGFKHTINTFGKYYDCLVLDQDIDDVVGGAGEDLDSITKRWSDYLSSVHYDKPVFVLILMPSYEGATDKGWIEPVGAHYGPEYVKDYKEQALVYEGFFRAVAAQPQIDGVISYGYWWDDKIYPDTLSIFRNDLSHSIRDKDAEDVFYRWAVASES